MLIIYNKVLVLLIIGFGKQEDIILINLYLFIWGSDNYFIIFYFFQQFKSLLQSLENLMIKFFFVNVLYCILMLFIIYYICIYKYINFM